MVVVVTLDVVDIEVVEAVVVDGFTEVVVVDDFVGFMEVVVAIVVDDFIVVGCVVAFIVVDFAVVDVGVTLVFTLVLFFDTINLVFLLLFVLLVLGTALLIFPLEVCRLL